MKKIAVYGDESVVNDSVVYAAIALEKEKISEIESGINEIKRKYGGKDEYRLHCREMFNNQKLKRGPWSHLSRNDVFMLYQDIALVALVLGARSVITCLNKRNITRPITIAGQYPVTPSGDK